ncbi:MAG TPA: MFS transporter [Pseudacidobacterium sp.]|jgi:fucose permease|nr:MFS transporter [Pseudacidobacterium sp.]
MVTTATPFVTEEQGMNLTSSHRGALASPLILGALYFGFVLTGIGTTLLGCALPALSPLWSLNDSRAGFLFATQFAGSSCGALLVTSRLDTSVVRGYLLIMVCGIFLSLCRGHAASLLFFGYGLGLGLAMTSTSMIIGRIYSTSRGSSLSLLNAAWGFGAVICPLLVSVWIHFYAASWLFVLLSLASVTPLIALGLMQSRLILCGDNPVTGSTAHAKFSLLLPLGIFAFLYVGVESSIGGWMMTYIHRLPLSSTAFAPAATSLFWIAILCGRTGAPAVLKQISESRLLTASLSITLAGILLLIASHTSLSSLASAALIGLMLAPIFPLCISRVLELTDRPSQSRWIFAISGLGGAVLPWMTGQFASMQASLRFGLIVPLLASGVMLLLHLRTRPTM